MNTYLLCYWHYGSIKHITIAAESIGQACHLASILTGVAINRFRWVIGIEE